MNSPVKSMQPTDQESEVGLGRTAVSMRDVISTHYTSAAYRNYITENFQSPAKFTPLSGLVSQVDLGWIL